MLDSGVTADQLGLDRSRLDSIIAHTQGSIGEMNTLNNGVMSLSGDIAQHMNSDAGRIMYQRLNTWTYEFTQIKGSLEALNTRVTQMRNKLVEANAAAADSAGSGAQ